MDTLAASSGQVVILRDSPRPGFSAPDCLARREWNPALSPATCTFDPQASLSPQVMQALAAAALPFPNVHLIDMTASICDQTPCAVGAGTTIKYRDGGHLSDSFVRSLTPQLRDTLLAAGAFHQ